MHRCLVDVTFDPFALDAGALVPADLSVHVDGRVVHVSAAAVPRALVDALVDRLEGSGPVDIELAAEDFAVLLRAVARGDEAPSSDEARAP
jgi:hypothetical protein